ncbi:MAG: DUF502 domain-containing protein [Hyphomicrobiaceae bacterium]|nr:DUF502 domain-containing protein [Hyphomicrobiaceae bacterium]
MEDKGRESSRSSRREVKRSALAARRAERAAAASLPAAPSHRLTFAGRIRNHFLTGLVVVAPLAITAYITWSIIHAVDNWVKPYIPSIYNPDTYLPFRVPGAGLLFAFFALVMIGALAANLIGRTVIGAGERMLEGMPIVRNLYRATKQLFESVVSATGPEQAFQKVAVMEFPSPGIYALVFITGQAAAPIAVVAPEDDLVAVFMPTHLMPPSGFTVFVPRRKVTVIEMSIEDAAKIILSAGMVTPDAQAKLKGLAEAARLQPKPDKPTVTAA